MLLETRVNTLDVEVEVTRREVPEWWPLYCAPCTTSRTKNGKKEEVVVDRENEENVFWLTPLFGTHNAQNVESQAVT
jgi:hypothetical protein